MNSTVFGVGIDTARYGHHVSFVDQDARTAANGYLFKEDMAGYEKLKKSLLALVKKCPDAKIRICIDPAGIYGNNLTQFLQKLEIPNMTVFVAHPERSKEYRKAVVGNKKADACDSLSCARFAVKENPPASPVIAPEMDSLRRCVSAIEALATERTMLINQLHSLLASVFPEFAIYASDIGASYCLKLLEKYPSGKRIASARLDSILSIPHMKEELAKAIHAAAKNSVARNCDEIIETLVTQKIKQIQNADMQQQLLDKTLKKAWDSLPEAPCKQLLTICGIGLQTAASIVAKVVDIKRFESPSKLIGYFGIYPTLYESGTTKEGSAKRTSAYGMARQGNDLVRRNLYMAAQSAAQHNPAVKALYARQRQLGKEHGVALGHCMAKLLRIAYALWVKDEGFDPNFEARQSATKQEEENVVGPNLKEVKPQKQEVTTTPSSLIEPEPSSRRKPLNYVILKACLNIEDILAKHRWKQRSSRGAQIRGRCLICKHQDENAFAANRTKNVYCCHRCGTKGNALDLLSELSKQPLHDAAWDWIDREGITPPLL